MADESYNSNLDKYDRDGRYSSPGGATSDDEIEELLKVRPPVMPNLQAYTPRNTTAPPQVAGRQAPRMTGGPASAPATPDYAGSAYDQQTKAAADLDAAERAAQTSPDTSQLNTLDTQIAGKRVPTQLRENRPEGDTGVGTGKMKQEFAPSLGRRIWRGVEGSTIGLLTGGIPGAAVGALEPGMIRGGTAYGAPNAKYNQTEADRQATLANLEAQRPEMSETLKAAIEARRNQVKDMSDLGKDRKDVGEGITSIQRAQNETPEAKGKAAGAEQTQKDAAAFKDRQQRWPTVANLVPPSQRNAAEARYLLTGEMPKAGEPRQPSAEEIMLSGALGRWRQANGGKDPNYEQFVEILSAVKGAGRAGGGGNEDVDAIVADAAGKKQEFTNGYTRRADGYYMKNGALLPADTNAAKKMAKGDELLDPNAFQQRVDQYRLDANTKLARHGAVIDAQGNVQTGAGRTGGRGSAAVSETETLKGPIKPEEVAGGRTAVGAGGHTIVHRNGQWVDPETGLPPSGKR